MRLFLLLLLLFSSALISRSSATSVAAKSLQEIVSEAPNIWGGRIIAVRMVDGKGRRVSDPEARTGPGLKNRIFLDVAVDPALILRSSVQQPPARISIPLWQMWHYSLGGLKGLEGSRSIFLLTDDLEPAYPAGFQRPLDEERKIGALIRKSPSRGSSPARKATQN